MLYGTTVSKGDLKNFQEKLGTLGKIVYRGSGFVVFHSDMEWNFLRNKLQEYIISIFNPDCELGKEIMRSLK